MTAQRSWSPLDLLQTIAIVVGLLYGALELSQFREEQRRQSRLELARSFMTPEFHQAAAVVLAMPDSISGAEIDRDYVAELPSLLLLIQTFETVGILVHTGDLDLPMVDEFLGTMIVMSWQKLRPWVLAFRTTNDSPSVAEWFQWLAERLMQYRAGEQPAPAYEAHRDWKP